MKLAVNGRMDAEHLAFARQLGVTDMVNGLPDCDLAKGYYDFHDLSLQKARIEDAGLTWSVLEGVPPEWCDKIKLGLAGRDEQIDNWCRTLENVGAVGIPVLGYFFCLRNVGGNYGLRTSKSTLSRGGAVVTSFDYERIRGARQDYWYPAHSPGPRTLRRRHVEQHYLFSEGGHTRGRKRRGAHEPAPR